MWDVAAKCTNKGEKHTEDFFISSQKSPPWTSKGLKPRHVAIQQYSYTTKDIHQCQDPSTHAGSEMETKKKVWSGGGQHMSRGGNSVKVPSWEVCVHQQLRWHGNYVGSGNIKELP